MSNSAMVVAVTYHFEEHTLLTELTEPKRLGNKKGKQSSKN